MKGILPVPCRVAGYALLLLAVFVPMLMYMFGMVHDGNLVLVKLGMKLVIWVSLFMVFLAKTKDENEVTGSLRLKAMKYALYVWGIYYVVVLVKAAIDNDMQEADNSIGIVYMVINVICWEFQLQKQRMERTFTGSLRLKAMKYALYVWGIYYVVVLVKAAIDNDMQEADNSIGIVYMVINVICWEFQLQKQRMERTFRRK